MSDMDMDMVDMKMVDMDNGHRHGGHGHGGYGHGGHGHRGHGQASKNWDQRDRVLTAYCHFFLSFLFLQYCFAIHVL